MYLYRYVNFLSALNVLVKLLVGEASLLFCKIFSSFYLEEALGHIQKGVSKNAKEK